MNFCVSVRQSPAIKKLADEFMIDYIDVNIMYDIIEQYPDKKCIIRIPRAMDIDWNEIRLFNIKHNITLAIEDLHMASECVKNNCDFYWAYPITSFYELQGVANLGVSELLIGAPLFFELDTVSKYGIPIRCVANVCYEDYIPRKDGICGAYIRPEDVQAYGHYIRTIEFNAESLSIEKTLFEIYKSGEWNGNLNLILTNLGVDVDNRIIPKEFAAARMACRHTCMHTGSCHFCETAIKFSNTLVTNKDALTK